MARTRIIIGNVNKTTTKLLYHGPSGSAAEAAMKTDTTCQSFEIFEGPGRRKNNPNYKPVFASINEVKDVQPEPVIEDEAPEAPPAEEAAEQPAAKAKPAKK